MNNEVCPVIKINCQDYGSDECEKCKESLFFEDDSLDLFCEFCGELLEYDDFHNLFCPECFCE